ncbi:hypothetical protein H4R33_000244 [Dimargaris cristalligena]|nr:hypothetical protein H4R33_000244 [Dimargaris cristalligena]
MSPGSTSPALANDPSPKPMDEPPSPLTAPAAEGLPQAQDFAVKALCPRILVLSTPEADNLVQRQYHLSHFADLLKPFGIDIPLQCPLQDGQGQPFILETLNVRFTEAFVKAPPTTGGPNSPTSPTAALPLAGPDDPAATLGQPPGQPAAVTDLVARLAREVDGAGLSSASRAELAGAEIDQWTPWYAEYRQRFLQTVGYAEHESFAHPVACIYVVASSHSDPVKAFFSLNGSPMVDELKNRSFAGPDIPTLHVMVHDEARISLSETEVKFEHTRRTIGQPCYLLKLNAHRSNHDLIPGLAINTSHQVVDCSNMWQQHQRVFHDIQYVGPAASSESAPEALEPRDPPVAAEAAPPPPAGQWLAHSDLVAVRGFVKLFLNRYVLMYMQRCIRELTDQVANSRRGLTGRLFSASRKYFGNQNRPHIVSVAGTGGTVVANSTPAYIYHYDSAESKLRKLADYAFMLTDYRLALSIYQTAKRDYANDKMVPYLAGAQEMIGVCKLLNNLVSTKQEYDVNFDEAVVLYHRCRLPAFAVRATLVYYELLKYRRLFAIASTVLTRTGLDRNQPIVPYLFEQAAYCQLKASPPHPRKFVFHLVVAARQFTRHRQPAQAVRCYRIAEALFQHKHWVSAENHINYALGHQAVLAHHYRQAIGYYFHLLAEAAVSPGPTRRRSSSLTSEPSDPPPDPAQRRRSSVVTFEPPTDDDSGNYPALWDTRVEPAASRVAPDIQALYLNELLYLYSNHMHLFNDSDTAPDIPDLVIPGLPNSSVSLSLPLPGSNALDCCLDWSTHRETDPTDAQFVRRCSVGETVAVSFNLVNPLHIVLILQNLTVQCEDGPASDAEPVSYQPAVVQELKLEPLSTQRVELTLTVQQPGEFRVTGVRYLLMGIIPCCKRFVRRGPRLNLTKEQRRSREYGPERSLTVVAEDQLPRAEVVLAESFPTLLQSGESQAVPLTVTNRGPAPIGSVRLWFSHPSFFFVGDPTQPQADIYGASVEPPPKDASNPEQHQWQVANCLTDQSTLEFGVGGPAGSAPGAGLSLPPLEPQQSLTLPLWVRGDRVGFYDFKIYVGYSAATAPSTQPLRSVKFHLRCQVQPSLKINAFVRPSTHYEHEQTLGIEVENLQTDKTFRLAQVTSISPQFEIEPIDSVPAATEATTPSGANQPLTTLSPRQATFLYFRIKARCPAAAATGAESEGGESSVPLIPHAPERFTVDAVRQLVLNTPRRQTVPPPLPIYFTSCRFGSSDPGVPCHEAPLRQFLYNSRIEWRRKNLLATYPLVAQQRLSDLFTTFESYDLDIVLFWEQSATVVPGGSPRPGALNPATCRGHHSITGINLGVPLNFLRGVLPAPPHLQPDVALLLGGQAPKTPRSPVQMFTTSSSSVQPATPQLPGASAHFGSAPVPAPASGQIFGSVLFAETLREKWALVSELVDPPRLRSHQKSPLAVALQLDSAPVAGDATVIRHAFATAGPHLLPFTVRVRNLTWCAKVVARFSLAPVSGLRRGSGGSPPVAASSATQPPASPSLSATAVPPAGDFTPHPLAPMPVWVGQTEFELELSPHAETTRTMYLCLPQPGTYNINTWRITGYQTYLQDLLLPPANHPSTQATRPPGSGTKQRPAQLLLDSISESAFAFNQASYGNKVITVVEG